MASRETPCEIASTPQPRFADPDSVLPARAGDTRVYKVDTGYALAMSSHIRLGRIAGIEIGLNWTWFIVFALITWTLAVGVFPAQTPGLESGAYWAMGVVAAVLFFASILLHELGHAIQARRDKVDIEGITLWLFGGVAQFRNLYGSSGGEFRIAVAGPAVTLVIAAVLIGVARTVALPAAVEGVVLWLGYINVFVLVFNLLPALPLDGGRILHAALWRARGDLVWATEVGTGIGIAFGWLMIGGGVVLFFMTAAFSGLWLAFIGWFLMTAARAEARQLIAREALSGLHVADLMAEQPVSVPSDFSVGRFVDEIAACGRFTTYPVVEGDEVIGLLALDAVTSLPRGTWDERNVRDCMINREDVPVVKSDVDAGQLLETLTGGGVNRALVVDGDGRRLVGLVSVTDIVRIVQLGGLRRRRDAEGARMPENTS
jgi:Zn-dependent protease/CBS domain-containing protein